MYKRQALYRVHGSGIDAPGITAWPVAIVLRPVSYTHLDVYKRQHRCDRDSGRASVLAQAARPARDVRLRHQPLGLTGIIGPGGPVRPGPTEPALLAAAASVAALVVAAYLCGNLSLIHI